LQLCDLFWKVLQQNPTLVTPHCTSTSRCGLIAHQDEIIFSNPTLIELKNDPIISLWRLQTSEHFNKQEKEETQPLTSKEEKIVQRIVWIIANVHMHVYA
jgi:hypothetical protein